MYGVYLQVLMFDACSLGLDAGVESVGVSRAHGLVVSCWSRSPVAYVVYSSETGQRQSVIS